MREAADGCWSFTGDQLPRCREPGIPLNHSESDPPDHAPSVLLRLALRPEKEYKQRMDITAIIPAAVNAVAGAATPFIRAVTAIVNSPFFKKI
jgi:hypothetical protein